MAAGNEYYRRRNYQLNFNWSSMRRRGRIHWLFVTSQPFRDLEDSGKNQRNQE